MEIKRSTVTYSSSSASTSTPDNSNINLKIDNVIKSRPPRAGYLKEDDFFDILINSYKDIYGRDGNDHYWHPGDLYINVTSILEVMCNTLQGLVDIEFGRPVSSVRTQ
jgi:hypothetical protein